MGVFVAKGWGGGGRREGGGRRWNMLIKNEKMKLKKFTMLLRAVHFLWKTVPFVKIEFNWKTSVGVFLTKEGGGLVGWNMLIKND